MSGRYRQSEGDSMRQVEAVRRPVYQAGTGSQEAGISGRYRQSESRYIRIRRRVHQAGRGSQKAGTSGRQRK